MGFDFSSAFGTQGLISAIKSNLYGLYDIGEYKFLVIDVNTQHEIEQYHTSRYNAWNSLYQNFEYVAQLINQSANFDPDELRLLPIIFFDPVPDDKKYYNLQFFMIRSLRHDIDVTKFRQLIRANFDKYRIASSAENIAPQTFYTDSKFIKGEKEPLTRYTMSVKVTEEELMYHMLIEKFEKILDDLDK
jgi:hypothetical protein